MEELKPCPKCGELPNLALDLVAIAGEKAGYPMARLKCKCRKVQATELSYVEATETATKKWNKKMDEIAADIEAKKLLEKGKREETAKAKRKLYGVFYKQPFKDDEEHFAYVYARNEELAKEIVMKLTSTRLAVSDVSFVEEMDCGLVAFLDSQFFEGVNF